MRSEYFKEIAGGEEEQRTLYAEQTAQLYDNARLGIVATAINSVVLAIILRNVISHTGLIAWVALLWFVSFLRYLDIRAFQRHPHEVSEAGYRSAWFMYGLVLSGMVWGSSALFLFPDRSLPHQVFLVFVIGGMVAGAAAAFSSLTEAFLCFAVPALSPIILRFMLLGGEFHTAMGGMGLLFGAMMFLISRRIKAVRDASVKLRFENIDLVSYLAALERTEKALRETQNALELRVAERTDELRNAYETLKEETRERQQVESQLRQAYKMEAIGTLAGGIAHDFNNMLAVIIGNAELALEELDNEPDARGNIVQIIKASTRATALIRQILAFSRKSDVEKGALSLTPLIKETYQLLRGALPSPIAIELDIRADADTIIGDPSQIQQVVMNLATNAAHAMEEKGGTLSISLDNVALSAGDRMLEPDMKPGGYLKLTVEDTGTGIAEDVQRRMFEPYFTTKQTGRGTGMGLAVVYGIVKSYGGAIAVESRIGKGTEFTIVLPSAAPAVKEDTGGHGSIPHGTENILFVDDEPAVAEMSVRGLERLGYNVTSDTSSRSALETFLHDPDHFDLVITDQSMPDLNGIELAERLLRARKDLPIILITGYSETVSPEKAAAAGISEFVMKPVSRKEIAETVRRVLDSKAAA